MNSGGAGGSYALWIAVGLLVAVGLVVALRVLNRKLRKRRAWAMIIAEREENKSRFRRTAESFASVARQLQTNSAVLEPAGAGNDIPQDSLARLAPWECNFPVFVDSAWQTVRQEGLTSLMQPSELREVEELYTDFDVLRPSMAALSREIDAGTRHAQAGRSGSQWLTEEIALMQAVRAAHDKLGADLRHFHKQHTDFVPLV